MTHRKAPISFFIPGLNGGGAQKVVVNLANAIVDLTDHPVHIVLARAEGPFLEQVRPEVDIVDLGTRRASRSIRQLALYLRRAKPAVLCSSLNYANVCAALAWELAGRPCRLVLREDSVVRAISGWSPQTLRKRLTRILMASFYPRADCVVALGPYVAGTLEEQGICTSGNIVAIPNPVDVRSVSTDTRAPENAPAGVSRPFIAALGRLEFVKGYDVLIRAFSELDRKDLRLKIVGEGSERPSLEALSGSLGVADHVFLPGFAPRPWGSFGGAKLFVMSSRWEGFPLVLVEALASGLPIVATDCAGEVAAILKDGMLGHLVPPENPSALAQAIEAALESPRASVEQRVSRAQEFSAPVIAQEYLNEAFALGGVAP